MIGDDAQGRIAQIQLARERRLRHAGHADDAAAVAFQAADFSRRLQARTLGAAIGRTVDDCVFLLARCAQQQRAQIAVIRFGEIDVRDRLLGTFEIGAVTGTRVVDDLVGHHERARGAVGTDSAHGGDGNDRIDPDLVQGPEVGPIVDFVRCDRVAIAVARQEDDGLAANVSEGQGTGRIAPWRAHDFATRVLQAGQPGQPRAADDGKHVFTSP